MIHLDNRFKHFQISLAKKNREIIVIAVPSKELYHFSRIPYGLTLVRYFNIC